jgi:hypothetical protein
MEKAKNTRFSALSERGTNNLEPSEEAMIRFKISAMATIHIPETEAARTSQPCSPRSAPEPK